MSAIYEYGGLTIGALCPFFSSPLTLPAPPSEPLLFALPTDVGNGSDGETDKAGRKSSGEAGDTGTVLLMLPANVVACICGIGGLCGGSCCGVSCGC